MTAAERMAALRRRVTRRIDTHANPTPRPAATEDNSSSEAVGRTEFAGHGEPETGGAAPAAEKERRNELHKIHFSSMRIHEPAQCDQRLGLGGAARGCDGSAAGSGGGSMFCNAAGAPAGMDPAVSSAATIAASQVAWHTGALES